MKHIISLGAGVQSSTMALMAAAGEITPMPDCAIFADTQSEPRAVYDWLDWLEKQLPFPVHRVTAGSLREEILSATRGERRMDARPPFFVGGGMLRRQCTHDYKLIPIAREQRRLLGLKRGQRWPLKTAITQWIGISRDEEQRAKASKRKSIINRWPLIEVGMTREDCLAWMSKHGFKKPVKSACTFCPYRDDASWRVMKKNDPESFNDAVAIDSAIRHGMENSGKQLSSQPWFLHRTQIPLVQVDFRNAEDAGQERLFDEKGFAVECEGMCGV